VFERVSRIDLYVAVSEPNLVIRLICELVWSRDLEVWCCVRQ
jgi:hypothetical protein